jgi:hypothetical protein
MSPDCQKKHNRSLKGIAFASNIDPEMFDLGMKITQPSPSISSWRLHENKAFFSDVKRMKLAKITLPSRE